MSLPLEDMMDRHIDKYDARQCLAFIYYSLDNGWDREEVLSEAERKAEGFLDRL